MTFGEKVRAARKERGLSQKELAARTGIAARCKKGAGIIPEGTRCKNRHRRPDDHKL